MWCKLIFMWENALLLTGPSSDLILLSTGLDVSPIESPPNDDDDHYCLREKIIKCTNNDFLKFICKSIQFFVSFWQIHRSICKKCQQTVLSSYFSKSLYSWKWKSNYFIVLHFSNASCNYSHVLKKMIISCRKQMWSESDVVISLLLPEL